MPHNKHAVMMMTWTSSIDLFCMLAFVLFVVDFVVKLSPSFNLSPETPELFVIQLTNWILWNGQFYYRDVIKMTITRAKGEGNGHFYDIEVIDLPFHTIPFVSCFISLIDNTKKWTFIANLQANLGFIFVLQSLLGRLFLALRTTLALMRSCVRSQELCARTMKMEDAYQVKITLQSRAPNVDSNSLTLLVIMIVANTWHFERHIIRTSCVLWLRTDA